MTLREAFETACNELSNCLASTDPVSADRDKYRRTFELMHGRLPSEDERETIKRRCLWYEAGAQVVAA